MKIFVFILLIFVEAHSILRLKPDVKEVTKAPNTSVLFACILEDEEEEEEDDDDEDMSYKESFLMWLDANGKEITESSGRLFIEDQESYLKKLYIQSIGEKDTGFYTCKHKTQPLLHPSISIKLSLFREISFEGPRVQSFNPGTDALVRCVVMGTPTPTVSWTFNNKKIVTGDKYEIRDEGLLVRGVRREDKGVYNCRAEVIADARFDKMKITVLVNYKPEWMNDSQKTTIFSKRKNVNITCSAKSEPTPAFNWFMRLNPSANNSAPKWDEISDGDSFRIFQKSNFTSVLQTSLHHTISTFSCHVSNPYGNISASYTVFLFQNLTLSVLRVTERTIELSWQPSPSVSAYTLSYRKVIKNNSSWLPASDWSTISFKNKSQLLNNLFSTNQKKDEDKIATNTSTDGVLENNDTELSESDVTLSYFYNMTDLDPFASYEVFVLETDLVNSGQPAQSIYVTTLGGGYYGQVLPDTIVRSLGGHKKALAISITIILIIFVVVIIIIILFFTACFSRKNKKKVDEKCVKVHLDGENGCMTSNGNNDNLKVNNNMNGESCLKEDLKNDASIISNKQTDEDKPEELNTSIDDNGIQTPDKISSVESQLDKVPLIQPSPRLPSPHHPLSSPRLPSPLFPPPPHNENDNICKPHHKETDSLSNLLSSSCYVPREDDSQLIAAKNRSSIMAMGDERWRKVVNELHEQLGVVRKSDEKIEDEEEEGKGNDYGIFDCPPSPKWKHT